MNKIRDLSEYEPTPLRLTTRGKRVLGATAATGLIAVTVAVGMNHEDLTCEPGPNDIQISENGTVWDEVGVPLAAELDVPTDLAMKKIAEVNPGIASLGDVDKWETVIVPVCEK